MLPINLFISLKRKKNVFEQFLSAYRERDGVGKEVKIMFKFQDSGFVIFPLTHKRIYMQNATYKVLCSAGAFYEIITLFSC